MKVGQRLVDEREAEKTSVLAFRCREADVGVGGRSPIPRELLRICFLFSKSDGLGLRDGVGRKKGFWERSQAMLVSESFGY